jgi:hypothetical protein
MRGSVGGGMDKITIKTTKGMDEITIKTPKPKCRLYWCLIEFYGLEIQSVILVFSTGFVNYCPSDLLSN